MKDFLLASLIGFLVGWLILPIASNLGLTVNPILILLSVFGFSVLAPLLLAVVFYFSRFWPGLRQFGKFCAVGVLNTLLSLCVINFFMSLTSITQGFFYFLFVGTGFIVATINSYFWNKFWSFQSTTSTNPSEFFRFFLFTFIGFWINTGVASFMNSIIGGSVLHILPTDKTAKIWANISALVAVAFSFLWNFTSYRLIIFKKNELQNK